MYNDIVDFYEEIFPLNQAFLAFIPAYLGQPGSRVLDLGCGPGDYVDHLSRLGYDATGIDPSAEMIRRARVHQRGSFYEAGFGDLDRLAGPFETIFSIGNSLSYYPADQMGDFFEQAARLLSLEGWLVLQVVNWDRYRHAGVSDFGVKTLLDGRTFHRRYEPGPGDTVIFHTGLRQEGERIKAWSDLLYPKYSADLQRDCQQAGLSLEGVFGDFQKTAYDPLTSPATVLVARKGAVT